MLCFRLFTFLVCIAAAGLLLGGPVCRRYRSIAARCDPMWHVSSRSYLANCYALVLTYRRRYENVQTMVLWEYGVLRCWHLLPIWLHKPNSCSSNPYSPTAFGCKAISRWRLLRHYGHAWPTHQNPLSKHNTSRKSAAAASLLLLQLQQITGT